MNSTHKPVRNIVTRSGGILRGYCNVAGQQVPFEGPLEQQFLHSVRLSSRVRGVRSQPMKLQRVIDGIRKSRTPDFLVDTIYGDVVVECKPEWKFLEPETRAHLALASQEVHRLALPYLVVTGRHLGKDLVENVTTLNRYVLPPGAEPAAIRAVQSKQDLLLPQLPLSVQDAVSLGLSETDLHVLMANRCVHIDFSTPLSATALIQPSQVRVDQDAASMLFAAEGVLADTDFGPDFGAEVIRV